MHPWIPPDGNFDRDELLESIWSEHLRDIWARDRGQTVIGKQMDPTDGVREVSGRWVSTMEAMILKISPSSAIFNVFKPELVFLIIPS